MKSVKNKICLFLCVLLFLQLVACNSSEPGIGSDSSTGNPDSSESLYQVDLTKFTIITPSVPGRTISLSSKNLKTALQENLGIETEIIKDNEAADQGGFEILIGNTKRDISATVLASLQEKEYAIVFEGNKIVLIGQNEALTQNAVDAFIRRYISNSSGNTTLNLSEAEIRTVWKKETISIIENGKTSYSIIFPQGNRDCEIIASSLSKTIKQYTNVTIFASNDFLRAGQSSTDTREILVGICDRPECESLKSRLDYNQYGVFLSGNKICLFGWNSTSTQNAADIFASDLKINYTSSTGLYELNSDTEIIRTNQNWNLSFPEFPSSLTACFDPGENQLQLYYKNTTLEIYSGYLTTLLQNGYTEEYENVFHGNHFSCFRNTEKNNLLYVSYTPCDGVTRLVTANAQSVKVLDASGQTGYTVVAQTSLTQVPVPCKESAGGQCYVVTLEDGSFLVNDGGGNEDGDPDNYNPDRLYQILKKLNKSPDGKIHIAAWLLTHEHWDHYDNFYEFVMKYKDELDIECMLYQSVSSFSSLHSDSANDFFSSLYYKASQAVGGITPIRVHTGQVYQIRNCRIEILYTPEDLFPTPLEKFNDSSVVYRLHMNGTSFMIVADIQEAAGRILVNRYGDFLKSDYGQVVHHGFWGAEYNLYEYMRPSVLLWPQTIARANNLVSSSSSAESYMRRNYSLLHNDFVTEVYYADGNPVTFTFSS